MNFREKIQKIKSVRGVQECIVFSDGLLVETLEPEHDPEQVSAEGEDLIRAGKKLTRELNIGEVKDLILETPSRKLLIYPLENAWVGIITKRDINLGLLRMMLESLGEV